MTKTQFRESFGEEWALFTTKPMFRALIDLSYTEGPIESPEAKTAGDIVLAGHVLYARALGFADFRKLLHELVLKKEDQQLEATYEPEPEKPKTT